MTHKTDKEAMPAPVGLGGHSSSRSHQSDPGNGNSDAPIPFQDSSPKEIPVPRSKKAADSPWMPLVTADLQAVEERLQLALEAHGLREEIHAAAKHLLDAGGKRFRPLLVFLSAGASGQDIAKSHLHALAAAAELIHTASLLHDDVVDQGDIRRGKPASRLLWGNAVSVLAGDYCLARSLSEVSSVGRFELIASLNRTVAAMVNAEALQLSQRGTVRTDRNTYFDIIRGKTATLMAWCASAGGLVTGETSKILWDMGIKIGMAFQIWDDMLDYEADASILGKALVQDLSEGKITLPFIEASNEDASLTDLLTESLTRTADGLLTQSDIETITKRVRATGAIEKTAAEAKRLSRQARALIEALPGDETYRSALASLADYTTRRNR